MLTNNVRTSNVRRKLLIVCQNQFGYHIDAYYYCKYLKEAFDITYICWDYSHPKICMDGINLVYVSRKGNKILRLCRYLLSVMSLMSKGDYDIHFIKYFFGCSLLKVCFPFEKFVFDIRTGSVAANCMLRNLSDFALRFESLFFSNITVISQSLSRKLKLLRKATILPLGADVICSKPKNFNEINLLYVGTLHQREIDKTVSGFAKFYSEHRNNSPVSYTIIGSGYHDEERELKNLTEKLGLQDVVHVLGRVPHNQLGSFFYSHNIGVSFVPITDFFDVQPVTKTFEYLVSGMPVIATATSENRLVVNEKNGVLITDTADGFCDGITMLLEKSNGFSSTRIMSESRIYLWESIINNFKNYLLKI